MKTKNKIMPEGTHSGDVMGGYAVSEAEPSGIFILTLSGIGSAGRTPGTLPGFPDINHRVKARGFYGNSLQKR